MVGQAKLSQRGQKLDVTAIKLSTISLHINPQRWHVCRKKMLQHSRSIRTLMRFQNDFGPIVARLGDRNEMLFCMICAWAEKLGKTHT